MFDTINQAKNAIEAYDAALKVNNANIANQSVPGYKRLDVSFQSILERTLNIGTSTTNPLQLGQGVGIAGINIDTTAGGIVDSIYKTDAAITGQGFFVVSGDGGNTFQYTRAGKFIKDANGNLTTTSGLQLYGLNSSGSLVPITGLSNSNQISDYGWDDSTGELQITSTGASTGYRIALTYFNNPSGLIQKTGTTFATSLASGQAATPIAVGGAAGTIQAGKVEQSNVNYITESINALEIQRAISANLSTVKAASDLISSFISKLG